MMKAKKTRTHIKRSGQFASQYESEKEGPSINNGRRMKINRSKRRVRTNRIKTNLNFNPGSPIIEKVKLIQFRIDQMERISKKL